MGCKGSRLPSQAGSRVPTRGAIVVDPDASLGEQPPVADPCGHSSSGAGAFRGQGCREAPASEPEKDSFDTEVVQPDARSRKRRASGAHRGGPGGSSGGCLGGLGLGFRRGRHSKRWHSKWEDIHATQLTRYTSQGCFAQRTQTVIFLDWDDTLFPTTYLTEELALRCDAPLHSVTSLDWATLEEAKLQVAACEARAAEVLRRANELGHVIVVTLASNGWVEKTCRNFFPTLGNLIQEMQIPVVYAKERADLQPKVILTHEESERYWGLIKGRAISEKAYEVYSQYEGQTWKNILSIGDSSYERYGLLAATSAYMEGRQLEARDDVWSPSQEGCWEKVCDGHLKKLRAKCCKLVDEPDPEELAQQLQVLCILLGYMVQRDMGFDLNLDTLKNGPHADVLDSIVRGSVPCWWALPLLLRLRW